jgi:MoxR-like ATPase
MSDWKIFQGDNREPHDSIDNLPNVPNWRPFGKDISPGVSRRKRRGETFQCRPEEVKMVNAALYLRRPLLLTGKPGTGKSSLAYAVARELNLGEVLYWSITTRTTLKDGLYTYDAIARLQAVKQAELSGGQTDEAQQIADYITLGPLGTAFLPSTRPRVLIIDEIDKSDIDLPNDLLTIFEEGRFEIPELARLEKGDVNQNPVAVSVRTAYMDEEEVTHSPKTDEEEVTHSPKTDEEEVTHSPKTDEEEVTHSPKRVQIQGGRITCQEFPLVILTSNGERDFPPPFLRRCLRLTMREPDRSELERIVNAHLGDGIASREDVDTLIKTFIARRDKEELATDQLLNAIFMVTREREFVGDDKEKLIKYLLAELDSSRPVIDKK